MEIQSCTKIRRKSFSSHHRIQASGLSFFLPDPIPNNPRSGMQPSVPQPLLIQGAGVQPDSEINVPHQLPPLQRILVVIKPLQLEYHGLLCSTKDDKNYYCTIAACQPCFYKCIVSGCSFLFFAFIFLSDSQ